MRQSLAFALVSLLLLVVFVLDLIWGSISISWDEALSALWGKGENETLIYLVRHFRLPKAIASVLAGSGVAVSGLMMQNLFQNPLADTSILGVGSGAGLGVAIYTMAFALFPTLGVGSGILDVWALVLAAFLGSLAVLLLVTIVATYLRDIISVLLVGVMIGFIASAFIAILQFLSNDEMLKSYLLWSFASVSGVTWGQLQILIPVVVLSLIVVLMLPKYMNAMNLGERYTHSLGINPVRVRLLIILTTSILSGAITAFVGPIAFLGIAVPHFTRMVWGSSDHRVLIPATLLAGATLMLLCDLLTQVPSQMLVLPINAITSLIGAPVVIFVLARNRHRHRVFN